jgi:folate-dependent phosphoribosylglycinamide formyltransferase PurN
VANVATWCTAINENREYDKTYLTKTKAMQAARSAAIDIVLKDGNLTPQQTVFIKEYQALIINLINKSPGVLVLDPYRLKALNCQAIEAKTASSAK